MDPGSDLATSLKLSGLPHRGLLEVLTSWSAGGSIGSADDLLRALGAVAASDQVGTEREWSVRDVESRASRVLWQLLAPLFDALPKSAPEWLTALPAVTVPMTVSSPRLMSPTNWTATVLRNHGWPPPSGPDRAVFVGRRRERTADDLLLSTLRWTTGELTAIQGKAARLWTEATDQAAEEMAALQSVRSFIGDGVGVAPSIWDVVSLESAGAPWNTLAPVAREILRLYEDPLAFALEVVLPDEALRGRLFHLAVYGELLAALRDQQYVIQSRAPLGGGAATPNHVAASWAGDDIELWFEASGAWRRYKKGATTYVRASAGVGGQASLSPDCLAVRVANDGRPTAALILECKDSADRTYVARDGYLQSLSYGTEFAVATGSPTNSFTVGRDDIVRLTSSTDVFSDTAGVALRVGVCPAHSVADTVALLLN